MTISNPQGKTEGGATVEPAADTGATQDPIARAAKAICANSPFGFCHDVGGDLGCKVGRGVSPHWSACIATDCQLLLSGLYRAAEEALEAAQ